MPETCPLCRKPTQAKFRPFCSNRCAQIDLHRWFGEAYRAPTQEPPEIAEAGDDGGHNGSMEITSFLESQ